MKNKISFKQLIFIFSAVLFVACNNTPQFTINGTIADAQGQTIYLEKRGITDISLIDSVKIGKDGSFRLKADAPAYPELYLLKVGKEVINLAIDSTETIEIKGKLDKLSSTYEVQGSQSSEKVKKTVDAYLKLTTQVRDMQQKFNKGEISQDQYATAVDSVLTPYKQEIIKIIASDFKSPAAYFALFQKIDNYLLLDPYNKQDNKMYNAVATAWDTFYKESDRAKHLYNFTINILKEKRLSNQQSSLSESTLPQVEFINLFDISLPNVDGKGVKLSSLKGKVVLLDFTSYQTEYSPAYNIKLNEYYQQFKGQLEIYQVALDANGHLWKNAAINLPWICVRDSKSLNSDLLQKYNVRNLPSAFLINKEGEIVTRVSDITKLRGEIQKLL